MKDKRRTAQFPTRSLKVFRVTFGDRDKKTSDEYSNVDYKIVLAETGMGAIQEALAKCSENERKGYEMEGVELLYVID